MALVEMQSKHEIKAFLWMSRKDSILKDFEDFLMKHNIESTPQDIGLVECLNDKAYD